MLFAYQLSRDMGRADVDRFLDELTPGEVDRWQVAYEVAGWGQDWERAATIAASNWDAMRAENHDSDKGDFEPLPIELFIPGRKIPEKKQQDAAEMEAAAQRMGRRN